MSYESWDVTETTEFDVWISVRFADKQRQPRPSASIASFGRRFALGSHGDNPLLWSSTIPGLLLVNLNRHGPWESCAVGILHATLAHSVLTADPFPMGARPSHPIWPRLGASFSLCGWSCLLCRPCRRARTLRPVRPVSMKSGISRDSATGRRVGAR